MRFVAGACTWSRTSSMIHHVASNARFTASALCTNPACRVFLLHPPTAVFAFHVCSWTARLECLVDPDVG